MEGKVRFAQRYTSRCVDWVKMAREPRSLLECVHFLGYTTSPNEGIVQAVRDCLARGERSATRGTVVSHMGDDLSRSDLEGE